MPEEIVDYEALPDRSDEVLDLKPYLRTGEKVIYIEPCPMSPLGQLPDYRDQLCKLCNVDRREDIGRNGPAMAARTVIPTPGQGLFECRFGRDGLFAAYDLMLEFPLLTRTTLLDYASLMGMIEDIGREEEYGRMFHEARRSDDLRAVYMGKGSSDCWPSYMSVDATPLFIKTLHAYITRIARYAFMEQPFTGRDGAVHTMWDALSDSTRWIVGRMLRNPELFIEYGPVLPGHLANQVIEDSWDSHFHADGTLANYRQGICSTEVQCLAFDALVLAAELMELRPDLRLDAAFYRSLARQLRKSILKHLVIKNEQGIQVAVGTDRDPRGKVRVLAARKAVPYFLLDSKIFTETESDEDELQCKDIVEGCLKTLFHPDMLCAAGLRSLAIDESRFMPGAYHNGSSWPVQTFHIAEGLRLQGYCALADELDKRIVNAIEYLGLYPEYFKGTKDGLYLNDRIVDTYDSHDKRPNRREQPPQHIQLWTLSAYGAIQYRMRVNGIATRILPIEERILSTL